MKLEAFDWDDGNTEKIKSHGLTCQGIEDFFVSSKPFVFSDHTHSISESRFLAVGEHKTRNLYVAFTLRAIEGYLKIRIISARYMHKSESRKFYEKKITK